jgi:hypothetical protein
MGIGIQFPTGPVSEWNLMKIWLRNPLNFGKLHIFEKGMARILTGSLP